MSKFVLQVIREIRRLGFTPKEYGIALGVLVVIVTLLYVAIFRPWL